MKEGREKGKKNTFLNQKKRYLPGVTSKSLASWISAGLSFVSSKLVEIFWEFWASSDDAKSLGIDECMAVAVRMVSICGVSVVVTDALDSAAIFWVWLTAGNVLESIVGSVESMVSSSIGIG